MGRRSRGDRRPTAGGDVGVGEEVGVDESVGVAAAVEVLDPREAEVGRFRVRRALPRRGLRTVGPWCFADQMGPAEVTETSGLDVGPHPHIGLQTVTWLVSGTALHRDSLGSEQLISPGQLNLMTAGEGIVHAEEATGTYRGPLHGMQLWVAQPEATRHGAPRFQHVAELPRVEDGVSTVTVIAGDLLGVRSPAAYDSELVGADAVLRPGFVVWPLHEDFEYAIVVMSGEVAVSTSTGSGVARPGQLVALRSGRTEVTLEAREAARVLLLGGTPFDEPLLLWWNFVARTREEVDAAYAAWRDGGERFGDPGSTLPRIPAPVPLWAPTRPAPSPSP